MELPSSRRTEKRHVMPRRKELYRNLLKGTSFWWHVTTFLLVKNWHCAGGDLDKLSRHSRIMFSLWKIFGMVKSQMYNASRLLFYSGKHLDTEAILPHVLYSETGMPVSRLMGLEEHDDGIYVLVRWRSYLPRRTHWNPLKG